jgi:hypothetical protein
MYEKNDTSWIGKLSGNYIKSHSCVNRPKDGFYNYYSLQGSSMIVAHPSGDAYEAGSGKMVESQGLKE